jgi:hypothetical protein
MLGIVNSSCVQDRVNKCAKFLSHMSMDFENILVGTQNFMPPRKLGELRKLYIFFK